MSDAKPTRFAAWLADNGMSLQTFVAVFGTPRKFTYFLANPLSLVRPVKSAPLDALATISDATGIPAGALIEDVPRDLWEKWKEGRPDTTTSEVEQAEWPATARFDK